MSLTWRRPASASLRFMRSLCSPCFRRSTFSRQSVERLSARSVTPRAAGSWLAAEPQVAKALVANDRTRTAERRSVLRVFIFGSPADFQVRSPVGFANPPRDGGAFFGCPYFDRQFRRDL